MPISIHPVTKPDIPRILDIQSTSMAASGLLRALGEISNPDGFGDRIPEKERREFQTKRYISEIDTDSSCRLMKVVDDENGDILAFAKWNIYRGQEGLELWKASVRTDEKMDIPEGMNVDGYRECKAKLCESRRKFFGPEGREHCLLAFLCTDPAHERRGAGSLLVKWGCDIADQHGVEAYLESSRNAVPVYQRRGFEPISSENLEFDVSKFTGRGGEKGDWTSLKLMVRKPQPAN